MLQGFFHACHSHSCWTFDNSLFPNKHHDLSLWRDEVLAHFSISNWLIQFWGLHLGMPLAKNHWESALGMSKQVLMLFFHSSLHNCSVQLETEDQICPGIVSHIYSLSGWNCWKFILGRTVSTLKKWYWNISNTVI